MDFFEDFFGGTPSARLSVLKPIQKQIKQGKPIYKLKSQTPVEELAGFLGTTTTFTLQSPLRVKPNQIVALSVPTPAPSFAVGLGGDTRWQASRKSGKWTRPRTSRRVAHIRLSGLTVPTPASKDGAPALLGDDGRGPQRRSEAAEEEEVRAAGARSRLVVIGPAAALLCLAVLAVALRPGGAAAAPGDTTVLGAATPVPASCPDDCLVEARVTGFQTSIGKMRNPFVAPRPARSSPGRSSSASRRRPTAVPSTRSSDRPPQGWRC